MICETDLRDFRPFPINFQCETVELLVTLCFSKQGFCHLCSVTNTTKNFEKINCIRTENCKKGL